MKVKQILFSIVAMVLPIFFLGTNVVSAGSNDSTITYERINGAYFYLQDKTTGKVDTNHVTKFFMNGTIAYCIEPMVDINGKIYNSTTDWNVTNISSDVRRYIERIGYFGYEYNGHQTDKYWLATQQLIWEKINPNVSVKFTTAPNGGGAVIDLSKEKNEILSLAEAYNQTASFAQTTVEGNIGDELVLTDTNGVLNEFSMTYNGKQKVTKEGNQLKIKLNEISNDEETIIFRKSSVDSQVSIIYCKDDSQKLASLKISDPTTFMLKIKSNGGSLEVNKKGEKLIYENGTYKYETIQLQGATFALYANEDIKDGNGNIIYKKYELVDTLTSDELGLAKIEGELYFGSYFLVEGESSQGNMVNNEKYYFEITPDDLVDGKIVKYLDMQNYLPKGELIFSKVDLTTGKPIGNTIVQIFTEDDKLIFTGTTDSNGQIVIDNLPVGKFYIIEKNPTTGYKLSDEKVYFEIKENGEVVKAKMTNEKIKGNLIFKKVDEEGNALAGVKIAIYNKDGSLYGTYVTDENGLVHIKGLEYGEYKIKEISTVDGYELEDDTLYFSILEDGKSVELSMINKRLPQTGANDYVKNIAILLIATGGIIVILKLRKKQK